MTYAQAWSDVLPDGSEAASDIDLIFRDLKIAIEERMDDLVGAGNWEDDSIQPKTVAASGSGGTGIVTAYYDDSAGAGSKVTREVGDGSTLFVRLSGTTDASGQLTLDLTEFTSSGLVIPFSVGGVHFVPVLSQSATSTAPRHVIATIASHATSGPGGSLTLTVYDSSGATVNSTAVELDLWISFGCA